ncbi:MAG: glycoside hydrolase family 3 domain protein, partial [Mucilaginibacter sp.]|nr:glycoside hydrolase family 3 domain protein [Mucilaginibacter sp.]
VRKLRGFDRIKLAPGEEKEVKLLLKKDSFYIYNQDMQRVTEPGWYQILIGASSEDIKLNTRIKL